MIILARLYVLTPAEGGRHLPLYSGYRAACWFGLVDQVGGKAYNDALLTIDIETQGNVEPGQEAVIRLKPYHPELISDIVRVGLEFELSEGPHVIGRGTILEVEPV